MNRQSKPALMPLRHHIRRRLLRFQSLEDRRLLATYIVDNTDDSGAGSLRQAILDANAQPGLDSIHFAIASGPQTIAPLSPMPTITDPVDINATTQPGYIAEPLIELSGTSAGLTSGIRIVSGGSGSQVRGLSITRFGAYGVEITAGANNVVLTQNWIGVGLNSTAQGNLLSGIRISNGASQNTIGGANTSEVQELTVNGTAGSFTLEFKGQATTPLPFDATASQIQTALNQLSTIQGTGGAVNVTNVANVFSIRFGAALQFSNQPLIAASFSGGTTASLAPLVEGKFEGNLISGNVGNPGMIIDGTTSNSNLVRGNYIGTNAAGNAAIANGTWGIIVVGGSSNVIGGDASAGQGNLISGNAQGGVVIIGSGASGNAIQGNTIGLSSAGTALGNTFSGIYIGNGTGFVIENVIPDGVAVNTLIGGASSVFSNTISDNRDMGIFVNGTGASATIQGNLIGTNLSGSAGIGNVDDGIRLSDGVINTQILSNVISSSTAGDGIEITNSGSGIELRGNLVGLSADGTTALGNNRTGIYVRNTNGLTIGGPNVSDRNVVAASVRFIGIHLDASANSTIQNNYIGTNGTGTQAFPNRGEAGLLVENGSNNVQVVGNLISGNEGAGFTLRGANTSGATVRGNFIGTDSSGLLDLGNKSSGIRISASHDNLIGGITATDRNVISGNGDAANLFAQGISIDGGGFNNTITGNYIGLDKDGVGALGNSRSGIAIDSPNNRIGGPTAAERNIISNNGESGIWIGTVNAVGNIVEGNYIGTDKSGTLARPNALYGMIVSSGIDTRIGGSATGAGNLISGNQVGGILVERRNLGDVITGNKIQGNIIGLNANGNAILANLGSGIILNNVVGTLVGTNGDGSLDQNERNIISGNTGDGVQVIGTGSQSNIVAGNYVGTDISGNIDLGNGLSGVAVFAGAKNSRVGTDGSLDAFNDNERNVLSGNNLMGAYVGHTNTSGTVVAGNYIGTNASGTAIVGNSWEGIRVELGAVTTRIGTDGNGVADISERNLVSGNARDGILVMNTGTDSTVVAGNFVGTDVNGVLDLGNAFAGIAVHSGATNTRVGSDSSPDAFNASERNLVSGNNTFGIYVAEPGTANTLIAGNYVGVDASGSFARANTGVGIVIRNGATNTTVGGSSPSARNIVSGNSNEVGIWITDSNTSGTKVKGNYIGLNAAGSAAIANGRRGIDVNFAPNTTIGTDGDGVDDLTEGNVISGNVQQGVWVLGNTATNAVVAGNIIGLDATGTAVVPNGAGILINTGAMGTRVGTNSDGISDELERNVISGNNADGILVTDSTTSAAVIAGNYIGTDRSGLLDRGNKLSAIRIHAAHHNTVGGTTASARNILSGNGDTISVFAYGVHLSGGAFTNTIIGNYIGLDKDGVGALGNQRSGIAIISSPSNIIGGTTPASRNIIASNVESGIFVQETTSTDNQIDGNFIGTDASGTLARPNAVYGIYISSGRNTSIGTRAGNLISGNQLGGVIVQRRNTGDVVTGNSIHNNIIGMNAAGTQALPNIGSGISVQANVSGTLIGELGRNFIAGNTAAGISLSGTGSTATRISGNWIGTNVAGGAAIPNQTGGIRIESGAASNIVGAHTLGTGGSGNVISGNTSFGILIDGAGSNSNHVAGNIIGLSPDELTRLPQSNGVRIASGAAFNTVGTNGDNVNDANERNVVSGNSTGILVFESPDNSIAGNYVGLTSNGSTARLNVFGISVGLNSLRTRIGTNSDGVSDALERNVVSGNSNDGISIQAIQTTVAGNYIGTNATGTAAIPNGRGISVFWTSFNTIIGTNGDGVGDVSETNVISGNSGTGVLVTSLGIVATPADRTVIAGNIIGLNAQGTVPIPNVGTGVEISAGATNTTIGTNGDGFGDASERNIISGNGRGISVADSTTTRTVIAGNWIGLDITGNLPLPNNGAGDGIALVTGTSGNRVGTNADGISDTLERNVIVGHNFAGIAIYNANTSNNVIAGNWVGINPAGTTTMGNGVGVWFGFTSGGLGPRNNLVGTNGDGIRDDVERNVVSANGTGVLLSGAGVASNTIAGNYIGTDSTGAFDLGNATDGVRIESSASDNLIGGTTVSSRNVISGNNSNGIAIRGVATRRNAISNNLIGLSQSGQNAIANSQHGVEISSAASSTTIDRNYISGTAMWESLLMVTELSTMN